jgi:hypothetical protein
MRGWAEAGEVMKGAKRRREGENREDGNGMPAFTGAFLGLKPANSPWPQRQVLSAPDATAAPRGA